jgi:hypothetical protein
MRIRGRELYLWLGLALLALLLALIAYFLLPGWIVPHDLPKNDFVKAKNDVRSSGVQLVGAMAVALGTFLTARTYLLNRQAAVVDRLTKAGEQLGSDQMALRLGAITALKLLARDEPDEHWSIMEQLAAHIRDEARFHKGIRPAAPPRDVRAALRALSERDRNHDPEDARLDLQSTDLRQLQLKGIRLERANLSRVHLENAILTGGADLSGAILTGAAMDEARLAGASLEGADLRAASLANADLQEARFLDADLTEADLRGADLTGAKDVVLAGAKWDGRTRHPDGRVHDHAV